MSKRSRRAVANVIGIVFTGIANPYTHFDVLELATNTLEVRIIIKGATKKL